MHQFWDMEASMRVSKPSPGEKAPAPGLCKKHEPITRCVRGEMKGNYECQGG